MQGQRATETEPTDLLTLVHVSSSLADEVQNAFDSDISWYDVQCNTCQTVGCAT